jgi:hypothetical protein
MICNRAHLNADCFTRDRECSDVNYCYQSRMIQHQQVLSVPSAPCHVAASLERLMLQYIRPLPSLAFYISCLDVLPTSANEGDSGRRQSVELPSVDIFQVPCLVLIVFRSSPLLDYVEQSGFHNFWQVLHITSGRCCTSSAQEHKPERSLHPSRHDLC